jgi:hypothetical protein
MITDDYRLHLEGAKLLQQNDGLEPLDHAASQYVEKQTQAR